MRRVGIRELKARTSEILRAVREEGESFEVTYHGRPVAKLVPSSASLEPLDEFWARWDALGREISEEWPKSASAVDAVHEQRREL